MDGYGRRYERIAGELRAAILAGKHRPGARIESENELAARYQVSRQTVRKALAALIEQGYLRAEHGRGTFVTERSLPGGKTIAVVTTYLADYIFPRVIQGIDQELAEHGYSILLKSTRNARHLEARYLEELADKAIDGLIVEPSKSSIFCRHAALYERFDARGIPYVETRDLEKALPELDILYMTRVQRERFFNEEDYIRLKNSYVLTRAKLAAAPADMAVLHPLPRVNEITLDVDDDPRAAYFEQAQNGVYMRMALIMTLLGLKDPKTGEVAFEC